jgi:spore coat protein U-like protein
MRLPQWMASFGLGIAILLLGSSTAQAQFGNCTISTTSVNFGPYDVFTSFPLDSTGSIRLRCVGLFFGTPVTVMLGPGNGPNASHRWMESSAGPDVLNYNLYLDAARTQVWGDPNPYAYSTTIVLFLLDRTLTVYGRVPAGQDVVAGTYTDTVTAIINF